MLFDLTTFNFNFNALDLVVHQVYQTDVNLEHIIRGNSVVIKCSIPSFVADYVAVDTWLVDDQDVVFDLRNHWGKLPCTARAQ